MCFEKNCPSHRHHHCRKKCPWHRKKSGKEERKRLEPPPPPPPPHKTELPRTRNTFFVLREKEVSVETEKEANVAISLYYRKLPNTEGLKKAFSSSKFRMRENGVASHATDGGGGGGGGGNNFLTSFSLLSWMHTCTKG